MPAVSYWFIRLSLIHFLLGFTFGAWLLIHKSGFLPAFPGLLTVHVELLLIGFMLLFALSVAWWILPRMSAKRPPDRSAWIAGSILTGGVWFVIFGATESILVLQMIGRLFELLSIFLWARLLLPRILIFRRQIK